MKKTTVPLTLVKTTPATQRHVNYATLDDTTLIILIAHTHPEALSELYDRYNRLVFSLALNLVSDYATAEDITLDVFTRVWEKAQTYRAEQAKVSTWLASIARYRSIDVLRQQNSRPEQHSISWAEISARPLLDPNDPEKVTELSMRQERIRAAMGQLSEDQKQVLALAYFKGYTQRQIAEVLGQPLGTVKTRICSAMQKLRQILQGEQSDL
jgi:RNA polymerase sigma-70 factor (ECF subfamily)